ncbi:DegT/DnrJ/EryC1/StrS family aminotransferase [Micromonospora sp. WMMC241]|uniref:DegT/DnrJ/EryC1/StrS family aminotransferase n=1 Tax=Micromonospora sp. WMMC241 TaxID=3015159 RepID=UPI0022B73CBE|nr:DegT/DnrJ/EryC1/StrS family aminotransferase [Micromonospora sp. WMMC241]MCZ7438590.1 DegT/DnrJ/EryC1/StrS family aminotransferase [Micromonospora sp. WMMC241]
MTKTIAKTATDPGVFRTPSLFYGAAREGMRDLLAQPEVWRDERRGILLPSFIGWSAHEGSGVFDPVTELGLDPGFYELTPDLAVDVSSLQARLAERRYDVVVVIHYFGRTERAIDRIRTLTDRHGALLLEDLAHAWFTHALGGPAGRTGEVSLYSLHKMLPMPGARGGMVTYRNPDRLTGQRETAPEMARHVLDHDTVGIARRRRENFRALTGLLAALPESGDAFELMWPELDADDAPQTLPVRILGTGRENRDHVYTEMNRAGFGMVSLYHTLVEHLREQPTMAHLARHVINFPVHQDVAPADYPALVDGFRRALRTRPDSRRASMPPPTGGGQPAVSAAGAAHGG